MTNRTLVLVRHGQSEWNLKNLFTGWRDVDLTEVGIKEARAAGQKLKAQGLRFDIGFTSALIRAQRSLDLILEEMGQSGIPVIKNLALNERDYGDLSGLNKDDARAKWGEEQVQIWRRSYDIAPPGGESLKDTAARVLPYYIQEILPRVLGGANVLVAAHGNSLRAMVKYLDGMSDDAIVKLNIPTGQPLVYELDDDLQPIRNYYLAPPEEIARAQAAVAAQGKAKT
jgi:2,3-bisphosphoglycerate-dependent phosphoglycerate mutase